MTGRLHEELIVPEAYGALEELARRDGDGRVPEEIVEAGRDPPGAEGMEEHRVGLFRLVLMPLVEEARARMRGIEERGELLAQSFDLGIVEHGNSQEKAVAMEGLDLVGGQPEFLEAFGPSGDLEEIGNEVVPERKVEGHGHFRFIPPHRPVT
jgi:hypothetical protein